MCTTTQKCVIFFVLIRNVVQLSVLFLSHLKLWIVCLSRKWLLIRLRSITSIATFRWHPWVCDRCCCFLLLLSSLFLIMNEFAPVAMGQTMAKLTNIPISCTKKQKPQAQLRSCWLLYFCNINVLDKKTNYWIYSNRIRNLKSLINGLKRDCFEWSSYLYKRKWVKV